MRRTTAVMLLVAALTGGAVPTAIVSMPTKFEASVSFAPVDSTGSVGHSRGSDVADLRDALCALWPKRCGNPR